MIDFTDTIKMIISKMTVEEKSAIVAGVDNMCTNSVPGLDVPTLTVADGPHGLRKQIGTASDNVANSEPATAFPTAVTVASSWNPQNAYLMGDAIGKECRHYGVGVLLGPGINIKKNPLCGRNFEYYSEDAYLTSQLAIGMVKGVQSNGIGVALKHFALNQSENYRFMSDSVCDMRAMREIYLKAFERVVKEAKPASLMCSYNKVNGTHASENEWLLNKLLREEWGYEGLVMSDWGAVKDRIKGIKAGLDLEMPGDTKYCRRRIIDAVNDGILSVDELDECVKRVLKLVLSTYHEDRPEADFKRHHELSGDIATDSAVLMKNDGVLPLSADGSVLILGELFANMRYQGAGSSQINATFMTTPEDTFRAAGADYVYAKGYTLDGVSSDSLIEEAVSLCSGFETVVVFAGLTDREESEGIDRTDINLPQNQLDLIDAVVSTGKRVVVVLFGGSVTALPFKDDVSGILNMFLPGQNGGSAVCKLLYGKANPSGRLSESWVDNIGDVPFMDSYSKGPVEVYRESVYVGYRYYVSADTRVAYPFGFGLSYTRFEYTDFNAELSENGVKVTVSVTNVGGIYGGEVVQLYLGSSCAQIFRPKRELIAFEKIYLRPKESKRVIFDIPLKDLSYYDIKLSRWAVAKGSYDFSICRDASTVISTVTLDMDGERSAPYDEDVMKAYSLFPLAINDKIFEKMSGHEIPLMPTVKPFTVETRIEDFKSGRMGKIIYRMLMSVPNKKLRRAKKLPEGQKRDNAIKSAEFLYRMISSNCLRAMSMSDKRLPYNLAEALVYLANGKIFKALGKAFKKIKVPPLPRDNK